MGRRRFRWIGSTVALALLGSLSPSGAAEFDLGGKPASLMGYVDQGVSANISREKSFDNKNGMNSAVFMSLLEGAIQARPESEDFHLGKVHGGPGVPDPERQRRVEGEGVRPEPGCALRRHGLGQDSQRGVRHVFARELLPAGGEADRGLGRDGWIPVDGPDQPGGPAPGLGDVESRTPSSRSGSFGRTTDVTPNRDGSRISDSKPSSTRMPGSRRTGPSTWETTSAGYGLRTFSRFPGASWVPRAMTKRRRRIGAGRGWSSGRG